MDYQKLADQCRTEAADLRYRAKLASGYSLRDAEHYDDLAEMREADADRYEAKAKEESAK